MQMVKVLVSARCKPESKVIIKNSNYTYGDAIDYFARKISNENTKILVEIETLRERIMELEDELKTTKRRIERKKEYLQLLESRYSDEVQVDEMVMESIRTIRSIAETFDCEPTEIDRFTGADTLEFHAKKCGITRLELEELLKMDL
ncbi:MULTISPECIES: hypothetical protein [Methanothermobacter]|uniref:Coil containing protein n=1 Tax=Methanothermobacter wolfeii TaxID=145261 RepID=A0A9E7RRI6_METWO|nr:hypothetical protein [Methanothermobacter wolfeii]MBC7089525.1 hypothetical protein [Methanobacteriaceae archaeon]UXH31029.1 hypothetical protein N5910_05630 [Methanothermobacter wolfeii]